MGVFRKPCVATKIGNTQLRAIAKSRIRCVGGARAEVYGNTMMFEKPGLLADLPPFIPALALVLLLLLLAAVTIALWRLHRSIRGPVRRMLDAVPACVRDDTVQRGGLPQDLQRLEQAFDEMNTLFKARSAILDQACELAGLGTWTLLPDSRSVHASSHIRAILGFPEAEAEVQLDAFQERIVPEDRGIFETALERALRERQMTDVVFRAFDAAGDVRILLARTGPCGAVPSEPELGISGIIQDITDLRHKETALARSLRLERLTGEAARIGGWRYETETRKLSGTRETANLIGVEGELRLSVEDVIARIEDAEDRNRAERGFWTCVGAGTRFDEIAKFRKFDGEETWLRVIGESEHDENGDIVAVYGATQDVGELIRARSTTEESRVVLQTIVDALSDGFVIHDRYGTIQYMNSRAYSILGAPHLDLVGSNIRQALPEAIASQFQQAFDEALDTGDSQNFDGEIANPSRFVNVSVLPTSAGIAMYLEDVTEERAVRERLRLLDAAVAQVNDVVLITEADPLNSPGPRVVFVNDAFVKMTGFSKEEILGATPRILQGPETETERLRDIRRAIEARQPVRTELTNYREDGSTFTTELDIAPLFDAAGECTHFVSIQRDTTERRADDERLRAREEQFRLASLASRDIIWDWDMQAGTIWNSAPSETIFGAVSQWGAAPWSAGRTATIPKGVRIENILERVHADDRLKIIESLNAALAGDAETWRCEYRITAQDGSLRSISDKAFIVRDNEGMPRRMVGAMSDITELRALDAQLHQSQKLETIGQLTGGIAHDFNNLLTIILGNCDILLDDVGEDSALRPLVQSIEDAAERGAHVSSDLLAFSRRQPLELRPTDINELIRRSSRLFERAVEASVEIRYELTDAPTVAYVDPEKLQAALLNLVINAMAAIQDQGTITFRTRVANTMVNNVDFKCQPGEYVEIDVADDGSGMSAQVLEHAFEPFYTTKEPGAGTGMGLSSVYGLVKQSNGHASIASELGVGTTVKLCLPVAHEPEVLQPTDTQEAPLANDGARILVVEDDREVRAFVCKVLGRMGYSIVEAENGEHALECLRNDAEFDLIITDIVMPGSVNGVQLAQKARKLHPDLRILFTSGYAQDALAKEKLVPSDIPMLNKPFRTTELAEKVKDVLSNGVAPDS